MSRQLFSLRIHFFKYDDDELCHAKSVLSINTVLWRATVPALVNLSVMFSLVVRVALDQSVFMGRLVLNYNCCI